MASSRIKLAFVTFLTVVRFPLVLLFFAGAIVHAVTPPAERSTWLFALSLTALIASAVTDLFDGYFARHFKVETRFGAHADPLMDKFFYLSTFPVLVFVATINQHLPHAIFLLVLTMLFLTRDQWVTFLRSIGSMHNVKGNANWSGKLRTCINFPLICAIYHFEAAPTPLVPPLLLHSAEVVALIVNLVSVYVYTRHYWPSLRTSVDISDHKEASS
jgi:CDP-diacylglycerol--glycerol-3-phosphate 3-phosphatidyltransferase